MLFSLHFFFCASFSQTLKRYVMLGSAGLFFLQNGMSKIISGAVFYAEDILLMGTLSLHLG